MVLVKSTTLTPPPHSISLSITPSKCIQQWALGCFQNSISFKGGANSKIPAPPLSKILASSMVGLIPKFRIFQIFILFLSICQNLPDFHTFSIFLSKLARYSYFFKLLMNNCQIFIFFSLQRWG